MNILGLVLAGLALVVWGILVMDFARLERRVEKLEQLTVEKVQQAMDAAVKKHKDGGA